MKDMALALIDRIGTAAKVFVRLSYTSGYFTRTPPSMWSGRLRPPSGATEEMTVHDPDGRISRFQTPAETKNELDI